MTAPPVAEAVRTKALAVLRDGRLQVLGVRTDPARRLLSVDAVVHGHRAEHVVTYGPTLHDTRAWHCSCSDPTPCAHVFAAEMVCHGVMPPGRDRAPKAKPVRRSGPKP